MATLAPRAVALGRDGSSTVASTLPMTVPAGTLGGDLLVAVVSAATATATCGTPTGWTLVSGPDTAGSTVRNYLFTKVAAGATGSASSDAGTTVTFTWSTTVRGVGVLADFPPAAVDNVGTPLVNQGLTGSTVPSSSATSSTATDALVVLAGLRNSAAATRANASLTGWVEQGNALCTASGAANIVSLLAQTADAAAGTVGGSTFSTSPANCNNQVTYTLTLKAASTNVAITLAALNVSTAAPAPTVAATQAVSLSLPALQASVAAPAPAVSATRSAALTLPVLQVAAAAPAMTVTAQGRVDLELPPLTVNVSAPAPALQAGQTALLATLSISAAAPGLTVTATRNLALLLDVAVVDVTMPAPAVRVDEQLALPPLVVDVTAPAVEVVVLGPVRDITVRFSPLYTVPAVDGHLYTVPAVDGHLYAVPLVDGELYIT